MDREDWIVLALFLIAAIAAVALALVVELEIPGVEL